MHSPKWLAAGDDLIAGKPTEQSSICHNSEFGIAGGSGESALHCARLPTEVEINPWWQVNLLDVYKVNKLRLFNDLLTPRRLRFFTVLFSLDGLEWIPVYTKKNNQEFGGDGSSWIIKLGSPFHTRYIRLRLDGCDQLTFQRLEAFGTRAIGPVTSVGVKHREKSPPEFVEIDGLKIYLDRENYSEILTNALEQGRYERRERGMLKYALMPGDRVLEIGTALGAVTMLAARIVGAENILTFDGNPQMIEHARRNFVHNGFGCICAENVILKNAKKWKGVDEKVEFFVSRNFWASGLAQDSSTVSVVSVPTRCFEQAIAAHNGNVLICDIEGGEIELLMDADLGKIDTIMMEIHYPRGEAAANRLIRRLVNSGFSIDLRVSGAGVVLLYRGFYLKRTGRSGGSPQRPPIQS